MNIEKRTQLQTQPEITNLNIKSQIAIVRKISGLMALAMILIIGYTYLMKINFDPLLTAFGGKPYFYIFYNMFIGFCTFFCILFIILTINLKKAPKNP